jgi:cobalamin synthase
VSLGAGVIGAALVTLFVRRAFSGRTGDTLGAGAVITELVVCIALAAWWH